MCQEMLTFGGRLGLPQVHEIGVIAAPKVPLVMMYLLPLSLIEYISTPAITNPYGIASTPAIIIIITSEAARHGPSSPHTDTTLIQL